MVASPTRSPGRGRSALIALVGAAAIAACASPPARVATPDVTTSPTASSSPTVSSASVTSVAERSPATTMPGSSVPAPSVPARVDRASSRVDAPATASEPAARASVAELPTRYVVPVADPASAGWSATHSSYPATDIFVAGGCGGTIVSPADGTVIHVRTVDSWDPTIDDPATRGGRSVAIRGHDGVRYYMAHFETILPDVVVGRRVGAGTPLGTVGSTGRSSACHIHFGISPPCPGSEWSVRRGVVWPHPYLDAWRDGRQISPAPEVEAWLAAHPDACALAAADAGGS